MKETTSNTPSYVALLNSGELEKRVKKALKALESCKLCPRDCGTNRLKDKKGWCRTGRHASVASHNLHYGEEPPISGKKGSGTIFFSNCNLRCCFCQNFPISQLGTGEPATAEIMANMMIQLQERGAHNINLVTPSHVVPQFIEALYIAAKLGLNIPIVYNSSGYDGAKAIKLLDGIVDIYMPDIKYFDDKSAVFCSEAPEYFKNACKAVKEMYNQVGVLKTDAYGIGTQGLLIRHLILPNGFSGSDKVFEFIATKLNRDIPVNAMSQYFPAWHAANKPELKRRITQKEYDEALDMLHKWGLDKGWTQEMEQK